MGDLIILSRASCDVQGHYPGEVCIPNAAWLFFGLDAISAGLCLDNHELLGVPCGTPFRAHHGGRPVR